MLTISADPLPQSGLSYIAFRISFLETLERLSLAQQVGVSEGACFGFLTEVPFLRGVAPHVQLDLLAETWSRHIADEPIEANLLEEAVIYAICETSSRLVTDDAEAAERFLSGGPLQVDRVLNGSLAAELRSLHANLDNEGDFLMVSQFADMHPDEARSMKEDLGLDEGRLECLFEVLGRWLVSADFVVHLGGLLTEKEIVRAVNILARR